jgi:hypothetical protein
MFAYKLKHPAVGAVLAMFSLVTILGNLLVITSVYKELYLRTIMTLHEDIFVGYAIGSDIAQYLSNEIIQ